MKGDSGLRGDADPVGAHSNGYAKSGSGSDYSAPATRSRRGVSSDRPNWGRWWWMLPLVTVLPYWLSRLHYALPEPQSAYSESNRPQPAESRVLEHVAALERIGYRTVGAREAVLGEDYVADQVRLLERQCGAAGSVLDCDVWVQSGTGYHSFNIMDHDLLKLYSGIRNVILRVAPKPGQGLRGPKDAILLGSHIDSTLPAPGAADDGLGVGVMLELARVMIERNDPINGSVIFMWNGAEETLQDGSHLYSTQHETAKDVRAVINLEAAGTTGGALLFQATSKEMIEAYAHAPHPRGTVAAADVFASGIIISDTDFGQFERYLNVTGLDMALVGHSYFYHTRKDMLRYIERGSAQHFANNIQAVLEHLLGPDSPLVSADQWHPPDMVYVGLYDRAYLFWSMRAASKAYVALAAVVAGVVYSQTHSTKALIVALIGAVLGRVGGIGAADALAAGLMWMGKKQLWFRHEHLPLVLYVPVAFLGALSIQHVLSYFVPLAERRHLEKAYYLAQMIVPTVGLLALHFAGLRSAYIMALISSVLLLGVIGSAALTPRSELATEAHSKIKMNRILAYGLPTVLLVSFAVEAVTSTLDIFTPLTGRMGRDAPAEIIIASLSSGVGLTFMPLPSALFHRLSKKYQRRVLLALALCTTATTLLMCAPFWGVYDDMHPKRIAVHCQYNHTSRSHLLHVGLMDQGPDLGIVPALHRHFGVAASPARHYALSSHEAQWDFSYPISEFMDTWDFPVMVNDGYEGYPALGVEVVSAKKEGEGRRLVLDLDFTDLIWPTLAFDAEVLEWQYDFPPPAGRRRHHIKVVVPYHGDKVRLEMLVRDESVRIDYSAIDVKQMVPSTAHKHADMPAAKLLLELDEWAEKRWRGALDITGAGSVTGSVEV